jgi:large subunit ribosomal protein L30
MTAEAEEADVARGSKSKPEAKTLKVTWVRSSIGYKQDQKDTIKSLGLRHLNQTVEHPDSPQVRGQIFKVKHLIKVEEE